MKLKWQLIRDDKVVNFGTNIVHKMKLGEYVTEFDENITIQAGDNFKITIGFLDETQQDGCRSYNEDVS